MNWLETILRIAPDNGDGSAEALVLLALLVAAIVAAVRRRRQNDSPA
jgi:MYXO-CTERM domain-containing protein